MKLQSGVKKKQRQLRVVKRLSEQLDRGIKFCKETEKLIPLTEKDIRRIKKEIANIGNKHLENRT